MYAGCYHSSDCILVYYSTMKSFYFRPTRIGNEPHDHVTRSWEKLVLERVRDSAQNTQLERHFVGAVFMYEECKTSGYSDKIDIFEPDRGSHSCKLENEKVIYPELIEGEDYTLQNSSALKRRTSYPRRHFTPVIF